MITDKTPQQIHEEKEAAKRLERETDLRERFKAEFEFEKLPMDIQKQVKLDLLDKLGYDPEKPLVGQNIIIRIIYHKRRDELSKNDMVIDYYQQHRERYTDAGYRSGEHDRGEMVFVE